MALDGTQESNTTMGSIDKAARVMVVWIKSITSILKAITATEAWTAKGVLMEDPTKVREVTPVSVKEIFRSQMVVTITK